MPGVEGQGVYGSDQTRKENEDWAAGAPERDATIDRLRNETKGNEEPAEEETQADAV